jgi:protein kinase-like protein
MAPELASGAVVGRFRVESFLARGAMAAVYRARSEGGQPVALKLLDPTLAHDDRFRQRFTRESELAATLAHPNIVATLGSGEDGGRLFLALELIDGPDLRDVLRRDGRLEPERAVAIVEQAAAGLDAAHRAGLVHRDVKTGNILLHTEDGAEHVHVCDFGLARHVSSVSSLTGERGFVGTIDYVPPEQIENGTVDARADVYSLGCVLYECLTGIRPFERDSELAVIFAHLNEAPPKATGIRPDLPAAFDEVIATALAKTPDDRYSSCGELAAAARAALHGRVLAPRRRRRRVYLGVAAAVAAAAVAVPLAIVLPSGPAKAEPVTVTPNSIRGVKFGDSNALVSQAWGGGQKFTTDTPGNYTVLKDGSRRLGAYFLGATDKVVEITTSNSHDRTAEGVGPCSTLSDLERVYGSRLKANPHMSHGKDVFGWLVGKRLMFTMTQDQSTVTTVALYSNDLAAAGFIASNDGPCQAAVDNSPVHRPAASAVPSGPAFVQTLSSRVFRPRVSLRTPHGWRIAADTRTTFDLASAAGTHVAVRVDPLATDPAGAPLPATSTTATGLASWLQSSHTLSVAAAGSSFAGKQDFTETTLELGRASSAARAVPYLTFSAGGPAPLTARGGRQVRLYLLPIRIDTLTHTLAIAADSPTRAAAARAAPVLDAMVKAIDVGAAAAGSLTALSALCQPVYRGTCLGEIAPGTYTTRTFQPGLTYTVPTVDWTNAADMPGQVGLIPPGGDFTAVDIGLSDYIDVFTHITTGNGRCADGHGTARTPEQLIAWFRRQPGIAPFTARPTSVGGLNGFVVDLRMRRGWTGTCRWSQGRPAQQAITGLAPTVDEMNHSLVPQPFVMRLYLLRHKGGTLGIEIDDVKGRSQLPAYDQVVRSFRFKTG